MPYEKLGGLHDRRGGALAKRSPVLYDPHHRESRLASIHVAVAVGLTVGVGIAIRLGNSGRINVLLQVVVLLSEDADFKFETFVLGQGLMELLLQLFQVLPSPSA